MPNKQVKSERILFFFYQKALAVKQTMMCNAHW